MNGKKANRILDYLPIAILLSIFIVALGAWTAGIYGMPVSNLLSADGIRWTFSHFIDNIHHSPLAYTMLLCVAAGVFYDSGLCGLFGRRPSLKQRRALYITSVVGVVLVLLTALLIFMPNAILTNSLGKISDSPFSKGVPSMFLILIIILSNFFGYASGRFLDMSAFVNAHTLFIKDFSRYFLTIMLSAQLMACIRYTNILVFLDSPERTTEILEYAVYYIPLLMELYVWIERQKTETDV